VEPNTGRYWLAIKNVIYVLSFWPSAKISAWSTITLPFRVTNMTVAGAHIFVRSGDDVYIYGGLDGRTYDTRVATVRTPHMPADTPTTDKTAVSIGVSSTGTWTVQVGMAAENPDFYETVMTTTNGTAGLERVPYAGYGTHIGFTLTCADAGPSILATLSVRFLKAEEK
jgi:hypothetical protein